MQPSNSQPRGLSGKPSPGLCYGGPFLPITSVITLVEACLQWALMWWWWRTLGKKSTRVITLFFCFFNSSAKLLLSDCKLQMYCLIVQVMLCMVIVPTCPFSSNVHFLHYFKYDFCPLVFVFMFSLLNSSLKVIALQLKRTAAFIFDEKRRMK